MPQPERPDEFELIERLFAPLAAEAPGALGLTDDAAFFAPTPGMETVLTVDAIVEGVHFLADDPADSVAQKLLRVNVSDLAAKGAMPRGYLLVTSWRADTPLSWMEAFARGLRGDQALFGLSLWGGDTVSSPGPLTFSLTAIGEVPRGEMIRRGGARAGDGLYLTGTVGDGALGLAAAQGALVALDEPDIAHLIGRYRRPEPRLAVGLRLRGLAHAALDVSDGLMADLGHLCAVSGVGARVEVASLPLSGAARRALAAEPALIETVLGGGDDYELLFAAPSDREGEIAGIAAETGVPIARIGRLADAREGVAAIGADGRALSVKRLGFRHF